MREVTRFVPKLLAVEVLAPFAFGLWWLTWMATTEVTVRVSSWKPCTVTLVVAPDEKRFLECELDGKPVRVAAPPGRVFRSMNPGDKLEVLMDPAKPEDLMNGGVKELWASTAMLALFAVFLTGAMIFVWRVDMGIRREKLPTMTQPKHLPQMEASRFSSRVIELRQPPNAYKASMFWVSVMGLLALWSVYGVIDGSWIAGLFFLAAVGMIWWLVRDYQYMKSFVLRSQGDQVWIESCRGEERISANDILWVEEVGPEVYIFLDANRKRLLTLRKEMGTKSDVMEVVRRLNSVMPVDDPED